MQHYESTQLHRTLNTTRIMEETTGTKEVESKASELGIDEEENGMVALKAKKMAQ